MNLGNTIKALRKQNGLTQGAFAGKCKISQTYASQVETEDKQPSLPMLKRIAKELDMPLPILFYLSLEEKDIPREKQGAFKILAPAINGMIKELFKVN